MSARDGGALAAQVAALKDCAKQAVDNGEYGQVVKLAARIQHLERLQRVEAMGASLRAVEYRVSAHIASMDFARAELRRGMAALAEAGAPLPHAQPESAGVPAPEPDEARARQVPHLPELEEVKVTERQQELWEKFGGLELDPVLGSGAVVLVDAEWMVERAGSGGTLEPRQALPPIAFMPHSGVKAATADTGERGVPLPPLLHIACVSHCWLQANHPDPHGHNLRILGRALQLLSADPFPNFTGRWAVFMDFCCIHQNCRDYGGAPQRYTYQRLEGSGCCEADAIGKFERERELFKEALDSLGSFYSHPATVVFMLTRLPDDYDNPAAYTRSGNLAPYFDRGWCFCESSWAMLTKTWAFLVDLGQATGDETSYFGHRFCDVSLVHTCAAGRKAPALPDAFEAELHSKGFTNGKDDRPRVAELYRSAFAQRFESAERLVYASLGWGDEEVRQVAAVLASGAVPRLQELNLFGNRVGDEGAAALAEAFRAPGALPSLQLRSTSPATAWGTRARPRCARRGPRAATPWAASTRCQASARSKGACSSEGQRFRGLLLFGLQRPKTAQMAINIVLKAPKNPRAKMYVQW
ncbi:unnamed protein product [Prorocentrum cordatum]|uniref:Uncharacterized protein n=1 Tax=Prorocentrum cordatum TaxID=2364126 RepID=A0ABN9W8H3_9DINO|nr:unnamed protein product [Polarella glacialis]